MVASGRRAEKGLYRMFRSETTVEYYDRESNVPLGGSLDALKGGAK
jgi:hypothetical protein